MTAPAAPVAETTSGAVRGFVKDGVRRWLGIPYARADRFAPPAQVEPWEGLRDADAHAPQCPQMFGTKARASQIEAPEFGEDCLALNVFVPDRRPSEAGDTQGRPVYVFIHGGAFVAGSSNPYDGSWLAETGDIVVVTINYRVSVLGFVNFGEALGLPDIPSNLGLRDQIAALRWVRDNIAAFGGDPGRVTIGGQSAGSMSVSLLLLSPLARGLFHGAVLQSGATSLIHDRESSVALARRYADELALDQGSLDRLRSMDRMALFEAQGKVQAGITGGIAAAPWYDGEVLPASFAAAQDHDAAPVPVIAGAMREEVRLFEWIGRGMLPVKRADAARCLREGVGEARAETILAEYPDDKAGNRALASDLTFAMPTRHFAHRHSMHHPAWAYRFDFASPFVGATHGMDLTVTWPFTSWLVSLGRGGRLRGRRKALGERFNAHIAHFARHGAPLDDWPPYRPGERQVKVFNLTDHIERDPDAARFAAWAGADAPARRIRNRD